MGFFSRKPQTLFPQNLAALLADWGEREFDRRSHPGIADETDRFVTSLNTSRDVRERRPEAIAEIRDAGLGAGGWSVYGAWEILSATFLSPVPDEVPAELIEPRVRFLHDLGHPKLSQHLNTYDMVAYERLFPEEYARMFPNA
jgi:hypothetical protein